MFRMHGRARRGPFLRTAPLDGGPPEAANGGAPNDGTGTGTTPPAFDPSTLSPEAKAYLDAQQKEWEKKVKAADEKARTGTRDNAKAEARAEVLAEIAKATGQKPAEVDPQEVAKQLAETRAANAKLVRERAIDRAARAAGGDADLVTALIEHKGLLSKLDQSAADYDEQVAKIVKEAVDANPRLKLDVQPARPPAAGGPVGAFSGGTGEGQRWPSLGDAVTQHYSR
jgi:hypothetical protein